MKFILFLILLSPMTAFSNPMEKSKYDPAVDRPVAPATNVPIEELQTSPNETPSQNQSEKFRGTLKGKQMYDEDIKRKKNKQDKK